MEAETCDKNDPGSAYLASLEPSAQRRYNEKLQLVQGIDPYTLSKKAWSIDHELFPAITYPDIVSYLVIGRSAYTLDQFRCYKSLEAYNQFVNGWVRDVAVKPVPDVSRCLITARVMHSQSTGETLTKPWVISTMDGNVEAAHCNCMAGLGETCTHVGALLFAVEYLIRHRENKTVTQEKAYWVVPSVKKVPYATVSDIDFSSAKGKKKKLDKSLGPPSTHTGKQLSNARKTTVAEPTNEEKAKFLHTISQSKSKPAILSLIHPYSEKYIPQAISKEFPQLLTTMYKEECYGMNYQQLLQYTEQHITITVTDNEAKNAEEATRQQANNKLWFRMRAGRITASKLKSVCHTDPAFPSQSLIKAICYPELTKFTSVATSWGCEHEKTAQEVYTAHMKSKHEAFQMCDNGLFISPTQPHLGASPDGLVSCKCCGEGCCEIKCPFCKRDKLATEAADDKGFCLEKHDDKLNLKKNHAYYYQVQAQIHITKREYCDFVVWTEKDLHVERILADTVFWDECVAKATHFFQTAILPELVGHFYSKPTVNVPALNSSNVEQSKVTDHDESNETPRDKFCYCDGPEVGKMIACDNLQCTIEWFHMECLKLKRAPQKAKWYCPDCRKLQKFRKKAKPKGKTCK